MTVRRPETAMERLLMAPSISPISMARVVPTAWEEEPMPNAPGHRFRNMEEPAYQICDHAAEDPGDNDDGYGNGDNAAQLLRYAHTDGGGDGFGQQGYVFLMTQTEKQSKNQYAAQAGQHAGHDSADDSFDVFLQLLQLLIKRNSQTDCRPGSADSSGTVPP